MRSLRLRLPDHLSRLAEHPDMLHSYTDLAVAYAGLWQLDNAERVFQSTMDRFGAENAELLHHLACVQFARYDLIGAKALFDRAAQAAPEDTVVEANLSLLGSADIDYQSHQALTRRLFANLTSSEFLYVADGERELTMPCSSA